MSGEVWVLHGDDFEDQDVISVHTTEAGAWAEAARLKADHSDYQQYRLMDVTRWEVQTP